MATAEEVFFLLLGRVKNLVLAPVQHHELLWMIIPMLLGILLMNLYFGRYRDEELGWNTAFGNSMIFIFVTMDIVRKIYISSNPPTIGNFFTDPLYLIISSFLLILGMTMLLLNYFHTIPKSIAFFISSGPAINVTIYTLLVIIYLKPALDWALIASAVILFILLISILRLMQLFQRMLHGTVVHRVLIPSPGPSHFEKKKKINEE